MDVSQIAQSALLTPRHLAEQLDHLCHVILVFRIPTAALCIQSEASPMSDLTSWAPAVSKLTRVKQVIPAQQLKRQTCHRPAVRSVVPLVTEDDFWTPVLPGLDIVGEMVIDVTGITQVGNFHFDLFIRLYKWLAGKLCMGFLMTYHLQGIWVVRCRRGKRCRIVDHNRGMRLLLKGVIRWCSRPRRHGLGDIRLARYGGKRSVWRCSRCIVDCRGIRASAVTVCRILRVLLRLPNSCWRDIAWAWCSVLSQLLGEQ